MGRIEVKKERRIRRVRRNKGAVTRFLMRNRLVVYRSLKHIYCQIVSEKEGKTLVSASSLDNKMKKTLEETKSKVEKSYIVGKVLAERAKQKNIYEVVFDRHGYLYHGRVKALAEGAREGGLKF